MPFIASNGLTEAGTSKTIAVGGMRSTGGATEYASHVPAADAPAVAALRAAGAVVFGKTNVPRWSSDYQTYNKIFGTTNNPWDLGRTPGLQRRSSAVIAATVLRDCGNRPDDASVLVARRPQ